MVIYIICFSMTDSLLMAAQCVCYVLHVSFQALVKGFGIDEKNMFEFWDVRITNIIMIRESPFVVA